jgi:hypothetical protein
MANSFEPVQGPWEEVEEGLDSPLVGLQTEVPRVVTQDLAGSGTVK